jgi:hypothetical protein
LLSEHDAEFQSFVEFRTLLVHGGVPSQKAKTVTRYGFRRQVCLESTAKMRNRNGVTVSRSRHRMVAARRADPASAGSLLRSPPSASAPLVKTRPAGNCALGWRRPLNHPPASQPERADSAALGLANAAAFRRAKWRPRRTHGSASNTHLGRGGASSPRGNVGASWDAARTGQHTRVRQSPPYPVKCAATARKNKVPTAITAPCGRPRAFGCLTSSSSLLK